MRLLLIEQNGSRDYGNCVEEPVPKRSPLQNLVAKENVERFAAIFGKRKKNVRENYSVIQMLLRTSNNDFFSYSNSTRNIPFRLIYPLYKPMDFEYQNAVNKLYDRMLEQYEDGLFNKKFLNM